MNYTCVVYPINGSSMAYTVSTSSAMNCSKKYGLSNDKIIVYHNYKPVSSVIWSVEYKKYIRINVGK